jgi:hypothetical protein
MISEHMEDVITAIKEMPNSLWKNKALSHAHDTLAALRMLETEKYPTPKLGGLSEAGNGLEMKEQRCTCPAPGAIDSRCPLHGSRP